MKTSRACSYLLQNLVKLFVGWMRTDFQPRVRVVFVAVEDVAERFHAIPAGVLLVIWSDYNVRPAVDIGNCLESPSEARPWPGNTHHCIVGLRIVEIIVAAPLWKEWTIPVGRHVAASYTHCVQVNQKLNQKSVRWWNVNLACKIAISYRFCDSILLQHTEIQQGRI